MNPSSNCYDPSLKDIRHYQSFPAMLPFVGRDYISSDHSKLLIFGESFCFPGESTLHKDPSKWYSTTQVSLNEEEVSWINCRGLLECPWGDAGHKMYHVLNGCLKELDLLSQDRPVSHICYTNTFMRPADSGVSFRNHCAEQDVVVSIDTLTRLIAVLAPDLVIFASKYSWDKVGLRVAKQVSKTTFEFVCHPTTGGYWWNNKSYPFGMEKFTSLLREWATKTG